MGKPFIYLFQAIGKYFFYDTNKNQVVNIRKELYDYLVNEQMGNNVYECENSFQVKEDLDELKKQGYLSSKRAEIIEHPLTNYCADYIDSNIYAITFQVTQSCNMRCRYCSFSGDGSLNRRHMNKSMSYETAMKAVDYLANHSENIDHIYMGFYGGEPLLAYGLIKKIVSYSKSIMPDKVFTFLITTNGTIMSEEIIDFLYNNDFLLTISIDGPEEYHNRYRRYSKNGKGTFQTVYNNMKKIKARYPLYYNTISINAVIDRDDSFDKCEQFFKNDDLFCDLSVLINKVSDAYLDFNYAETIEHIISSEELLFKQLVSFIRGNNPLIKIQHYNYVVSFSSLLYEATSLPEKIHHLGPCIPGQGKLFVDIEGNFRPCEKVSEVCDPMIIGSVYSGMNLKKVQHLLNIARYTEKECLNCWAIRLCRQCALNADDSKTLCREKKLLDCYNQKNNIKESLKDYVAYKYLGLI